MTVSTRSLLIPGVALAAAGVVALGPAVVAPPAVTLAQPAVQIPTVQVQDIALAGIGRDIYDEITVFVQYTVESAQFWIDLIPVIGPPLADQLGINYFGLIQPLVANTVYYISDVIADPFNFIVLTANYGSNLFYTGYTWVSQQAQFFGLPPLFPIPVPPPLASVEAPSAPAAGRGSAAPAEVPAAAATEQATEQATDQAPAVDLAPVEAAIAEAPAAPKTVAVRAGREGQRSAASSVPRAAAAAKSAAAADDSAATTDAPAQAASGKAGAARGSGAGR